MRTLCLLLLFTYVSAYEYGHYVEEGALCRKRSGEVGVCTHFSKCPSAIKEVKNNGRPEICSFAGIYPIVCCYDDKSAVSSASDIENVDNFPYYHPFDERKVNFKKCKEYHSESVTKGSTKRRFRSTDKHHPHMALLGIYHRDSVKWRCSGALISENFLLTAALCIKTLKCNYVRLGDLDIKSNTDDANIQEFRISNVYFHPDSHSQSASSKNIALVQLDRPAKLTNHVRPACVGITDDIEGSLPEAAGYELDSKNASNKLETHYLKYSSDSVCRHLTDKDGDVCAGNGASCDISYGSPLQISNFFYEFNSFPEVVALMKMPESCTDRKLPGIYTKLHPYLPWIEGVVWPDSY